MDLVAARKVWEEFKQSTKSKSNAPIVNQVADIEVARAFVETAKEMIADRDETIKELEGEIEKLKQQLTDQTELNKCLENQMTERNIMNSEILQRENTELRNQLNFFNVDYRTEMWRPIKGYGRSYEVSNRGEIRSCGYSRILRQCENENGDIIVTLEKLTKEIKIEPVDHLLVFLVAEAFLPNPYNFTQLSFIDGNRKNYRVENLRWIKPTNE